MYYKKSRIERRVVSCFVEDAWNEKKIVLQEASNNNKPRSRPSRSMVLKPATLYGRGNTQRERNFRVPFFCHDVSTWRRERSPSVHAFDMSKPVMTRCFQSATEWTASVHPSHMSKPVMTFVFKVLCNWQLPYILDTCRNLWWLTVMTFGSNSYGMDCIGTYFTHVQSCDVIVLKVLRSGLLRYILHTCPKLWCKPCSKSYGMDCFGTYFTHVQSCDVTRVQSATEWTASVHTSHMSKAVM